ncbi:hypothetical protein EDD21DRAFT_192815 [Dissophora ornata]|nr:hypothetical protein EDD21DRAFT_192815 [Dissophora ornata]
MEFPTVGANCASPSCQSLSFLPFQCSFCSKVFCSAHRLPQDHACAHWSMEAHANSVQLCLTCERMVLVPKGQDPTVIIKEHQESGCSLHLLPAVQSIAVPCARSNCNRRDRVVQTCPGCGKTFCLGHRHQTDHDCLVLQERKREAEAELQRKKNLKATIAEKFVGGGGSVQNSQEQQQQGQGGLASVLSGSSVKDSEKQQQQQKAENAKLKAEVARTAIAEAKARVAARNASTGTPGATTAATPVSAPPKVKKASRVVSVMKLKKTAQGEDKIPLSSRVYVSIRSPIFPQLDDKAVYVDKTWTVGRSLDKIVEWLKVAVPKNEPFDALKVNASA